VTAEIRHLFRARRFSLTSGLGRFQSDRKRDETTEVQLPPPLPPFTDSNQFSDNPEQTNAYAYSIVDLPRRVTVTIGASADFYKRESLERNQFNPKLGIVWEPTTSTTFRAAVLRTLNRTVISSQTIEPTEVAGFSQLFADGEAEEAREGGVAIDHKFTDVLFGGAEYLRRKLFVPVEFGDGPERTVEWFPRRDQFGRAYLYWAPEKQVSLSVEYFDEHFDHSEFSGDEAFLNVQTNRLALGAHYFHPSGAIIQVTASYIHQDGDFIVRGVPASGKDEFWVFDSAVGYRLPKRFGRLTFEVKNLFDQQFRFQDTDPASPRIRPGRLAVFRFVIGL
jgi:outer membrane receptor protein involved in Fe transport